MKIKHVTAACSLRENVIKEVQTALLIRVDESGWIEEAIIAARQHNCLMVDHLNHLMKQKKLVNKIFPSASPEHRVIGLSPVLPVSGLASTPPH